MRIFSNSSVGAHSFRVYSLWKFKEEKGEVLKMRLMTKVKFLQFFLIVMGNTFLERNI